MLKGRINRLPKELYSPSPIACFFHAKPLETRMPIGLEQLVLCIKFSSPKSGAAGRAALAAPASPVFMLLDLVQT